MEIRLKLRCLKYFVYYNNLHNVLNRCQDLFRSMVNLCYSGLKKGIGVKKSGHYKNVHRKKKVFGYIHKTRGFKKTPRAF